MLLRLDGLDLSSLQQVSAIFRTVQTCRRFQNSENRFIICRRPSHWRARLIAQHKKFPSSTLRIRHSGPKSRRKQRSTKDRKACGDATFGEHLQDFVQRCLHGAASKRLTVQQAAILILHDRATDNIFASANRHCSTPGFGSLRTLRHLGQCYPLLILNRTVMHMHLVTSAAHARMQSKSACAV